MSFEPFNFRPGRRLSSDDEFSSRPLNNLRYPDERDLDTKFSSLTDLSDLQQHLVDDLEEVAKLNIRDQSAQLRLPKESATVSMDLQQFPLQS